MRVGIKGIITGVLLLLAGTVGLWFVFSSTPAEEETPWLGPRGTKKRSSWLCTRGIHCSM